MTLRRSILNAIRHHGQQRLPFARSLAKLSKAYLDGYNNDDHDMARNGELQMLHRLTALAPRIAFDVGANRGDWATGACAELPGVQVHAFEIAPAAAVRLSARMATNPRCAVNGYGLGEADASIPLEYFPDNDTLTTRVLGIGLHPGTPTLIEGRIRRGHDYCAAAAIDTIDILKIDVEGAEHQVLEGFGAMLGDGRIHLIQFEYGIANITSRVLLKDYYAMLGAAQYEIGKLYPFGVEFGPYRPEQEDFRGPNFVAVHRSRPEVRAAVAG
jgi:FkbM family methyltransferase